MQILKNGGRGRTEIIILVIFILAASFISACQPAVTGSTLVAAILQTIEVMELRTPLPSLTPYPTQIPYDTQTPYPGSKEERIVRPVFAKGTRTPYPTQTAYPTEVAGYSSEIINEILVNPGLWSKDRSLYGYCGDMFEVRLGFKTPYYTYAIGNEVSKMQFLIVNLMVNNISNETIPLLFHKQFKLLGDLNGEQVEYTSYGPAGQSAADQYGKMFIGGVSLPPEVETDTYIGFDADYHVTNLRLVFRSDDTLNYDCYFELPITTTEFGIQYYSTMQAGGE